MGLAERRATKAFQDNQYQGFVKEINKVAGKELEIDVDWNSISELGMSHLYEEYWPKVYFEPVIEALKSICADEMGKEAILESLDKVIIQNKVGTSNLDIWANFEDKVLTLDHQPTSNIHKTNERISTLISLLENNL